MAIQYVIEEHLKTWRIDMIYEVEEKRARKSIRNTDNNFTNT